MIAINMVKQGFVFILPPHLKINFMKQVSLYLNIVLILAVGYLFYMHFSESKPAKSKLKAAPVVKSGAGAASNLMAYVDLDTLNEKITYIKNKRKELETEQEAIENEWQAGYKNLENQKNTFYKNVNAITREEEEKFQIQLQEQQYQIDNKKQTLTQKLNEKSYKIMDDIQKKIKEFLEEYNADKKYSYIFTVGTGLEYIVYKDSTLNITEDVVDGMNEILNKETK